MLFKKNWKCKATGVDGLCILFGVNIFDYTWNATGEQVTVIDPKYRHTYNFNVFTANIAGKQKRFAAGEFSNCLWGFYLEK